jgi:ABC-type bacteriocin/lantibiotic exporter with double-glycine peptidase domain
MKLDIPHFRQTTSYTCVPACIRMILAYWGHYYSEENLVTILGVRPYVGTLVDNVITGLETIGFHAKWFENASIAELKQLLNGNWPVIVFLQAKDLQSDGRGYHALVIYGIESGRIFCHDPLWDKSRIFRIPAFRTTWAKTDYQGLVIWQ